MRAPYIHTHITICPYSLEYIWILMHFCYVTDRGSKVYLKGVNEKNMMSDDAGQMLMVYDDPSDQRSLSLDDTSSTEESPDETRLSLECTNDVVPYIGQRFPTHDAAYEYYSEFAKSCGFSIRRHRTEGKDGVGKGLTRRYFVCHRAGNTPIKTSNENKPQRNRKSSRCGCQAYMRISKVTELGAPEWRVTGFANNHNHELLEPNQVRFLPAYRTISETDKSRILMFAKTGISVQQMMRLMELEKCVEPGYLPFTEKDVRNLLQSIRKLDPEDESVDLLRMCRNIKEKDPNFRYEYTLDSNNRLENIAWSYASSIQAYEIFGDAVVFDTTHRLTALDMPLGIWVGVNNYGVPCFFGCTLLREENLRSFSWALKVIESNDVTFFKQSHILFLTGHIRNFSKILQLIYSFSVLLIVGLNGM